MNNFVIVLSLIHRVFCFNLSKRTLNSAFDLDFLFSRFKPNMSCISVISHNPDGKFPYFCESSRVDTIELKSRLFKRLGRQRSERYLINLTKLFTLKLTKHEFDKLSYSTIGKENIALHNLFIKSIIGNACKFLDPHAKSKKTATGNSRISNYKLSTDKFGNAFVDAPKRVTEKRIQLRPSGKQPNDGFIEVGSVEDGEEVEQVRGYRSPCVQSRSPIRAPLGIPKHIPGGHFSVLKRFGSELPDTHSLHQELVKRLATHQISLSEGCANLLNISLDVFLKRLVRAGTELARARHDRFDLANSMNYSASLHDFKVAFESQPELLGANWPLWLEKMSNYILECQQMEVASRCL
jgi:Transcriptional regulator of RNA polII, SAGA, subunit